MGACEGLGWYTAWWDWVAIGLLAEGVTSHCSQPASWLSLRFIIFPCSGQDSEHIDSGGGFQGPAPADPGYSMRGRRRRPI